MMHVIEMILFSIAVLATWEMFFRGGAMGYRAEAATYLNRIQDASDLASDIAP